MNLNNADPIELLLHVQDNFGLVRPSSKYDESFGHHFPKGTPVITRVVLNEGGVVRTVYDTDGARDDDGVIRTVYETDTLQQAAEAIKRLRREWSRRGCCLHPDYIPPPVLRVRGGVWCLSEGNPITFIPWKDIHPDVRDEQSPWYIEGLKRDAWLDHGETGNEG